MKKTINAKIIADSTDGRGNRITTYILTYPRFIHGELMTHRMFSRNAASSRAIPFKKMVREIEEDPFIPIAWQKDHKGMQGTEYLTSEIALEHATDEWFHARNSAIHHAKHLHYLKGIDMVTKQLCNRLLEPFQWMTTLVTATEYDNFFELRCPQYEYFVGAELYDTCKSEKDVAAHKSIHKPWTAVQKAQNSKSHAEIHIQALAEAMWDAHNESEPKELKPGEWHIPFGDNMNTGDIITAYHSLNIDETTLPSGGVFLNDIKCKIATARAARISYTTHKGEIDYAKDVALHDTLLKQKHASAFEHCARMMTNDEFYCYVQGEIDYCQDGETVAGIPDSAAGWCRNFRGFIPYRHIVNL